MFDYDELDRLLNRAFGVRCRVRAYSMALNPGTGVAELELEIACDRFEPSFPAMLPSEIRMQARRVTWIDREERRLEWHPFDSVPFPDRPYPAPPIDIAHAARMLAAADAEFES